MGKLIYLEDYKSKESDLQLPTIEQQEQELEAAYDELNSIVTDSHEWDKYFKEFISTNPT